MRDRIKIAREDEYQPKPGNGNFWLELAGMLKNGCAKRLESVKVHDPDKSLLRWKSRGDMPVISRKALRKTVAEEKPEDRPMASSVIWWLLPSWSILFTWRTRHSARIRVK